MAFFSSRPVLGWLIAVAGVAPPASPQYRYDVWTADNGLPQNIIRGICQTREGYLWLATLDGLARFDGVRFTVFNKANSPGIDSNRFTSIYEDRDGDLWLLTESGGVTRYHRGVFTSYTTQQGLPGGSARSITGDGSGHLWVVSGRSVVHWEESAGRFVDIGATPARSRYNTFVWGAEGHWTADEGQLHCYINGRPVTYPLPAWLPGSSLWTVARDPSGTIWLQTVNGEQATIRDGEATPFPGTQSSRDSAISYRDRAGHLWTIGVGPRLLRYFEAISGGARRKIEFSTLFEDREGNLWLGTEGQGLYRARRQFITVYSQAEGLAGPGAYPVYQDAGGTMWIGAWAGGLSRYRDGQFKTYTTADGLANNHVTAIVEDKQGQLWVGAQDGLRVLRKGRFYRPDGPAIPRGDVVEAVHQDRQGTLWVGTSAGLLRYSNGQSRLLTEKDGLAGNDARVIVDGDEDDLWIGGYGGVSRLRNGQFTRWTEHDGLPSNTVRAIYIDSRGVVWIGTYDGGLGRLENGRLTRYTMREGLFNNGVFQILEDARGNFWMSSNRGIQRVSKKELDDLAAGKRSSVTSIAYSRSDGMRNAECNGGYWPAGVRAGDGKLWFPTQDGVAVIDPDAIPTNPLPPPVVIESFLLDGKPLPVEGTLRIPPDTTNFEIQYTALSLRGSEKIQFRYKLDGLDSAWIDAGLRRTAYYSHLAPGDYVFRVIARNSDGVWNTKGQSLAIAVSAPYYRTWWFETAALACAASLIWIAWRYRVTQLKREQALQQAFSRQLIASQENERKRIAAELHDSLGQRLVVVKNLALFYLREEGGTAGAKEKLSRVEEISAEASLAINETREIAYNLRPFQLDRLGLTKAIAAMIRTVSTASGIRFTTELDPIDDVFAEDLRINFYRIVQECLNNIVKHAKASSASVSIRRSAHRVALTVKDDGRGFTPGATAGEPGRGGFGTIGMAERARLLGGALTVQSAPGRGTSVRFEIDLRTSHGG